jgi:hypothetical protein
MSDAIRTGSPFRRCSWSYAPIISRERTRAMIRWLDSVCAARTASRPEAAVKTMVVVHGA